MRRGDNPSSSVIQLVKLPCGIKDLASIASLPISSTSSHWRFKCWWISDWISDNRVSTTITSDINISPHEPDYPSFCLRAASASRSICELFVNDLRKGLQVFTMLIPLNYLVVELKTSLKK